MLLLERKAKQRKGGESRHVSQGWRNIAFSNAVQCALYSAPSPAGEVGLIGQPLTCCQVLWSSAGNAEWVAIPGRLPHSSPAVRFFMLSSPYRGCLGGRLAWRSCTLVGTWRQNVGAGQYWAPARPLPCHSHACYLLLLLTHMTAVAQHACRVLPPWRSSDKTLCALDFTKALYFLTNTRCSEKALGFLKCQLGWARRCCCSTPNRCRGCPACCARRPSRCRR